MNTRTLKVASRTLTVLAIGTALTLGGASVAAASSRHGRDGGAQNGWGGGQQNGGQQNGGQNGFGGWTGGQHANARGDVTAYTAASGTTAGSITIKEHDGTSVTFSTSSSTTITEVGGTGDTLAVGDVATVQAAAATPTVASAIKFHLPPPVCAKGSVTAYTAASGTTAGSITIKERDGTSVTFSTSSSTTITEAGGTGDALAVGDVATVQAAAATPTVAAAISFRPPQPVITFGHVTAYTAASGTTAGSITLQGRDGTSVTFSTSSSTTITEVGGTGGTIAVGDVATVQAAAATPTVASSVWFFVAPTLGGFSPQNFSIASGNRDHHGGRLDARARFSLK